MTRVAARDRDAMREVYDRTSAKLFGVCLRIFPQAADAEDALQDAFMTIWQRAGNFDPARGSPITWLVTVTRNRAIDRLRAQGQGQDRGQGQGQGRVHLPLDLADEVADPHPDAEASMIASGEGAQLLHCLGTLAPGDAMMLRTAFFEGATYADLAERSAIPLGTIKSRVRRALTKLRACLT